MIIIIIFHQCCCFSRRPLVAMTWVQKTARARRRGAPRPYLSLTGHKGSVGTGQHALCFCPSGAVCSCPFIPTSTSHPRSCLRSSHFQCSFVAQKSEGSAPTHIYTHNNNGRKPTLNYPHNHHRTQTRPERYTQSTGAHFSNYRSGYSKPSYIFNVDYFNAFVF